MLVVDALHITEQEGWLLASISARRGTSARNIGHAISIEMPEGPYCAHGRSFDVIGTGPGTWLVRGKSAASSWSGRLERQLAGLASVSDQTGTYRIFRIEGRNARTLLQRGASIDLDDGEFPSGSIAVTIMGHIDIIIRRLDAVDAYELAIFRSYSESFLRWLNLASATLRNV